MILIGLTAEAHHGKTTAAQVIMESAKLAMPDKVHHEIAFASVLKKELAAAFSVPLNVFYNDEGKESPHLDLRLTNCANGDFVQALAIGKYEVTRTEPLPPRLLMQRWADWRLAQDPAYFTRPIENTLKFMGEWDKVGVVIVSDVRQPHEELCIRQAKGTIWKLFRPSQPSMRFFGRHRSEAGVRGILADTVIVNEDLEGFKAKVREHANQYLVASMGQSA